MIHSGLDDYPTLYSAKTVLFPLRRTELHNLVRNVATMAEISKTRPKIIKIYSK